MTLFTLSPDIVRGLACAVWLAILIALFIRRPAWRHAPGGVRLMLAGLAIVGAGLLIGAVFTVLHQVTASPDRIAAEAISLIAGLFALAGVLRFRPVLTAPVSEAVAEPTVAPTIAAMNPTTESADKAEASAAEVSGQAVGEDQTQPADAIEQFQMEKQEAMTRLAGGLAHDFSNVLTVILTASEILLLEQDMPEKVRRRIERMHGAAQRGAKLTDQLRAYAGRQDLQSEEVDLHELLRSEAVEFKAIVGPKIELHYEFAEGPSPVWIDPEQMSDAVATVLVYCRSTLPDGGRVVLSSRFETAPGVEAVADNPPGAVVLTIARSGVRLKMEQAHRLLAEPYSTGTSSVAGGGFGLSLIAGFIRQSGGEARFVEEPGVGPVLEMRLPLIQFGMNGALAADGLEGAEMPYFAMANTLESSSPANPPVRSPDAALMASSAAETPVLARPVLPVRTTGPLHVLVVEDDDLMQESVAAELASLGCPVTTAATPAEALDRLERDPTITALLSDLTFSNGGDGTWLARQARSRFPHLRLVLMSADITRAGMAEDNLAGLLPKPFTRAQLAASLGIGA